MAPSRWTCSSSAAIARLRLLHHQRRAPLLRALPAGREDSSDGQQGGGGDATTTDDDVTRTTSSSTETEDERPVEGLRGILRDSQHHPSPSRRSPAPGPAAIAAAAASGGSGGSSDRSSGGGAPCDETVARLKSLASSERRREDRDREGRRDVVAEAEQPGVAPGAAAPTKAPAGGAAMLGGAGAQRRSAAALGSGVGGALWASSSSNSSTITPSTAVATTPTAPTTPNADGSGSDFSDANFPRDGDGRTLHLGTRRGEVAARVLSVGSMDRALALATLLAPPRPGGTLFQHLSSRGFLTVTGRYAGRPVSVVTTLMGMPNMDFVARECRAVVDSGRQMAMVRLGTCGGLRPPVRLGDFVVASGGARCLRRNPDAWRSPVVGGEGWEEEEEEEEEEEGEAVAPYHLSRLVPADPELSALLAQACAERTNGGAGSAVLQAQQQQRKAAGGGDNGNGRSAHGGKHAHGHGHNHHQQTHKQQQNQQFHSSADDALSAAALADPSLPPGAVHNGRNVTADGFYASQGRVFAGAQRAFDDRNAGLVEEVLLRDPRALSMEMETFHLLDLARCSRPMGEGGQEGVDDAAVPLQRRSLRAAAVAIAAAERYSNAFISKKLLRRRELEGGLAALDALVRLELAGDDEDDHGALGSGARATASVWSVAP